jgi:hypothetical protein
MNQQPVKMQPWMAFAFPALIAVVIIAAFMLGGPYVGFLLAVIVALVIVGVAIQMKPVTRRQTGISGRIHGQPAPSAPTDNRRWIAAAAKRSLAPIAIAAVGIVLAAVWAGTVRIIGWGVLGVATVLALSLVFLEVGYSEDRALARERRARSDLRRRRHVRRAAH